MINYARVHELQRELRARMGGYFWLPCPRCGKMFGGNELGDDAYSVRTDMFSGKMACFRHKAPENVVTVWDSENRRTILETFYGEVVEIIPWDVEKVDGN